MLLTGFIIYITVAAKSMELTAKSVELIDETVQAVQCLWQLHNTDQGLRWTES